MQPQPAHSESASAYAPDKPWHSLEPERIFQKLGVPEKGLTTQEAAQRLAQYGPNVLPVKPPPTLYEIILHQFKSPLIYVLIAAGVVAMLMKDVTDALFIFGIVILNAALGAYQEWKAEQSAAGLQSLLKITARVRRDGEVVELPADQLVPGDYVLLESGASVPADLRLLEQRQLAIDESFLTGESIASEKNLELLREDIPVSDRHNMAYAGSIVTTGRGSGVVVATGTHTEVGKIASTVTSSETSKPPLVIRMEKFAHQVSYITLAACALLAVVAFGKGMPMVDVFFLAVALAVSAIPEGLPVAMTVALSIATSRMAKRNVIVRRLTAVEGLGSCTYIASDKTGTLTLNQQTVKAISLPGQERLTEADPANPALVYFIRTAMIASETVARSKEGTWKFSGDAVDIAFWNHALELGIDPQEIVDTQRLGEIPFESERAYSAALYEASGSPLGFDGSGPVKIAAVKGAPEVLIPRCRAGLGPDGEVPLDHAALQAELDSLTETGHRVMAVAIGKVENLPAGRAWSDEDVPELVLLGLVGLIDPPRVEVREAVEKCRKAGIQVAMVTGDHPLTALAIAREVGIEAEKDQVITGKQLTGLGSPEGEPFREAVNRARVFARVSPMQKMQIVETLTALGHYVAVTGDGVNDAPALKRAAIGVAMGSGTDVTKETASIIVTDDNFASIEAGVEEGRFAYDNIRKVTYLLISMGTAEVLLFMMALLTGLPLPLLPVQLLWLNLVTNGIQDVALAFEGGEPGTMNRPPRNPKEGIFNRLMIEQTLTAGATTAIVAFANFYFLYAMVGLSEFDARDRLLLLMVLIENYHAFNCRSEYSSVFRVPLRRNYMLVWGVLAAQGIHIAAMFTPFMQNILQVAPVSLYEWLIPFVMASIILIVMETYKVIRHGRHVAWASHPGE
jgi:calcium-translocating P-type ATPase